MPNPKSETNAPRCNGSSRPPRRRLGLEGLAHVESLLAGPAPGWSLESAALRGPELELSLVKASRRVALQLGRDAAGGVRTSSRGDRAGLSEDERALLDAVTSALAGADYVALLARLNRDALLYSDADGGSAPSRFERYYRAVDHSPDYWKFVYPEARFLEQEVRFGARYAQISHATLECNLNNPRLEVASLRFFAGDEGPAAKEGSYSYTDTDIGEADVVGGRTQELLGRVLERVAREEKPAFIHLKTTCLPELVGDTPLPFLARLEREHGVPVLWTSKTHDCGKAYEEMIERMLASAPLSEARDPRAVVLAGLPSARARAEAERLLRGLGLRVVGEAFPNLDFAAFPEIGSAGAVVWYDPVGWAKISDEVFLRRGLKVVRWHPPYGAAGTRSWLARVASVLGMQAPDEAAAPAGLAELTAECRVRTVALAGDPADIELLTSQGRAFGFSVAGLLCELGFNVRCLVWSPRTGAPARALRRARAPRGAGTLEFEAFSTRAGLDRLLGKGTDLVFTHFNHDPRLEARGLRGFNDRVFEPGLEGLLRTGRTLLARCAARPFPRHRAFLAPRDA